MNNPFDTINTEPEAKNIYRMLAKKYHPDLGGDTEDMKLLNRFYHECLKRLDGSVFEERTYKYEQEVEQAVMDKISEILSKKMDLTVTLIGNWIWITGDTRPHKEVLKECACKWHRERACWFWNAKPWKGRASRGNLNDLAVKYGAKDFKGAKQAELRA